MNIKEINRKNHFSKYNVKEALLEKKKNSYYLLPGEYAEAKISIIKTRETTLEFKIKINNLADKERWKVFMHSVAEIKSKKWTYCIYTQHISYAVIVLTQYFCYSK